MKNQHFLITFLFVFVLLEFAVSQDFDIYKKGNNDNFVMPDIPENMTFEEFQLLSRNLRMKDMLYAMVVPGYSHFYAKEPKIGYYVLGSRMLGYGGLVYSLANTEGNVKWQNIFGLRFDQADVKNGDYRTQNTITAISLTLIVGSYFFDWIHGKSMLEIKQEKIRFKYSLFKMQSYDHSYHNQVRRLEFIPLASVSVSL